MSGVMPSGSRSSTAAPAARKRSIAATSPPPCGLLDVLGHRPWGRGRHRHQRHGETGRGLKTKRPAQPEGASRGLDLTNIEDKAALTGRQREPLRRLVQIEIPLVAHLAAIRKLDESVIGKERRRVSRKR